jgi:hypothetical protein
MSKVTCYGCDYFFNPDELTEIFEPHLPADIKLCGDCMKGGE